jgi:hypothetical protein
MQIAFGVIVGIGMILLLRRSCRCEYCDGRLKFPFGKKPYCVKCGRPPSEADVHT